MHFFIHNSFQADDVILARPLIEAIRANFPGVSITLETTQNNAYLWKDLGLPIAIYQGVEYRGTASTPNCPSGAVFVNMCFRLFDDIFANYGITYENQVHTFNRQMYGYSLQHSYQLAVPPQTPLVKFYYVEQISGFKENGILLEGNVYLPQLAQDFPNLTFYCVEKPAIQLPNIIDCSTFNLIELSVISSRCIGLALKNGAINAVTLTETNRHKPRCILGGKLAVKFWDNFQNPTVYAKDYVELKTFLLTVAQRVSSVASFQQNNSIEKILIVSHKQKQCGVYQFGLNVANALKKSTKYSFVYAECSSPEEFFADINNIKPSAIIYNFHPSTLPWLSKEMLDSIKVPHISVIHEVTQTLADSVKNSPFQYYTAPDPTLIPNNPIVFKTGRLILPYVNKYPLPQIPTIGSFGFGLSGKGFERVIHAVQQEYDQAHIRLHIPFAAFGDADGAKATAIAQRCQSLLVKPGIKLSLSHEFLSEDQLLDFLAQNTVNAFFYETHEGRGISSTIDYALAVQRPIAITKSTMFRHLFSAKPSICIEDSSLKQIINNGITPLMPFYTEWSESNLIKEYERIMNGILGKQEQSSNLSSFNRILDDTARLQYKPVIDKLFELVPDMMARKIPEANIQQAFVFDTVHKFASRLTNPKMLCVGSFDDTAAASLKKVGYQIEEIDPAINCDLNVFFHKPTTIRNSYDVIFSTSVIEHVRDDELFISQIAELLAPGGTAVLTCDYNDQYKPGDRIPQEDFILYTQRDFKERFLPLLKDCSLVDAPNWDCPNPDFLYAGCRYTFASFVFQKRKN